MFFFKWLIVPCNKIHGKLLSTLSKSIYPILLHWCIYAAILTRIARYSYKTGCKNVSIYYDCNYFFQRVFFHETEFFFSVDFFFLVIFLLGQFFSDNFFSVESETLDIEMRLMDMDYLRTSGIRTPRNAI